MGLFTVFKSIVAARKYAKHVQAELVIRGCSLNTQNNPNITKLIVDAMDADVTPNAVVVLQPGIVRCHRHGGVVP